MTDVNSKAVASTESRARSVAFVGLTIAIMAVSASISIAVGPVPFTLQMFAVTFAIVLLTPGQAMAAISGYLLLGAIGLPVFSGMRGGIGVLAGPTGGFLWGYLLGVAAAVALLHLVRTRTNWDASRKALALDPATAAALTPARRIGRFLRMYGVEVLAGILFTAIAYACGCVQYMNVVGVSLEAAFLAACAPFIVVDLCKIVAAVACAQAVKAAVR